MLCALRTAGYAKRTPDFFYDAKTFARSNRFDESSGRVHHEWATTDYWRIQENVERFKSVATPLIFRECRHEIAYITESTKYDRFGRLPLPEGEGWGEGLCTRVRHRDAITLTPRPRPTPGQAPLPQREREGAIPVAMGHI